MAGINNSIVWKCIQLCLNAVLQLFVAAAGEIGPAYAGIEECVTAEQHTVAVKAYLIRAVTRCKQRFKMQVIDVDIVPVR